MRVLTNYGKRTHPARRLRQVHTEAEKKLWSRLRDRRLCGFKFRRQFPLGPFFTDFCCFDERLIVEVDGSQHADMTDEDANRTHYIAEQGFRVLRFWNNDVLSNTDAVCEQILKEIKKPHPSPLP